MATGRIVHTAILSNIGKLLPDLFAVFDPPKFNAIYINPEGMRLLDPANTSSLERIMLTQIIGVNELDRFNREIYPQTKVLGTWKGTMILRDLTGSEAACQVKLLEVPDVDQAGARRLYLYANPSKDGASSGNYVSDSEMLYALLRTTPDRISFKDVYNRYIRISHSKAEKHHLADPVEAIGKTDFDFFKAEHAAKAVQEEQEVMKTGVPIIGREEKMVYDDGRVSWATTDRIALRNRADQLIGVFTVSRDTTAQKKAEEALRENLALFQAVFNGSNDALMLFSEDKFIDCNTRTLTMFGCDKDWLLRMTPAEISPPEQPDGRSSESAARFYLTQALEKGSCQFDWVHRRYDKSLFPAEVSLSAFEFHGQRIVLGAVRDMTDKKQAEMERREMEARLQLTSKLESVGSLAAGVAHEVNTPTQYLSDNIRFLIGAFAQLDLILASHRQLITQASANPDPDCAMAAAAIKAVETENELEYLTDEIPRCLEQSMDGLRRIGKIVGSLKEFSHPGGEEKSHADINRAIETTVAVSRHEWKYVADVVTELDSSLPKVNCVIDEINQAVLNLIVNASHAIEEANKQTGATKGLITIRTRLESCNAIIEVQDTGTGIPEHARDRIFEPFFTTKPVGKGTGQGLAIVQAVIVKKHHGDVSFTTELGKGTTFRLSLPLTPQAPGSTHQTWAINK